VRLVVLDLNLPDMDGLDVCRLIRTRSSVPVVMLTARDEEADRLAGLETGADDYIGKPFSPQELVARMKAVLRRTERHSDEDVLVLGDIVLRRRAREVGVAGEPVELRPKEFDLLAYLMQNRGAVLSRDLLLERVWGYDYEGGTRTVDVHVAQLRRKLGRPDLIRTIRGSGYKAVQP
jgi:two-component system alkaline phosphatase synthesis response regulator PhoP